MLVRGGEQLLGERDRGREAHPGAGVDGRQADGLGDVRLAGAAGAQADDVLLGADEVAVRARARTTSSRADGTSVKSKLSKLFSAAGSAPP